MTNIQIKFKKTKQNRQNFDITCIVNDYSITFSKNLHLSQKWFIAKRASCFTARCHKNAYIYRKDRLLIYLWGWGDTPQPPKLKWRSHTHFTLQSTLKMINSTLKSHGKVLNFICQIGRDLGHSVMILHCSKCPILSIVFTLARLLIYV